MGGLIVSGFSYFVQNTLIDPALQFLSWLFVGISQGALLQAHLPWVSQAVAVSTTVAGGLLFVNLAWRALTEYVLWNEGSSSDATGTLGKGVLRVAIYGAAGTWLAYNVFQFGIWLAGAYMAAPLLGNVQVTHNLATDIASVPNVAVGTILFVLFGVLAVVVVLVIVTLQMAVRAADLVLYIVAAPLVALGQMNRDGGVWSNWWRSLIVLSLSQAVQLLSLKGMLASTQLLMTGTGSSATTAQMMLVILWMLGWGWVTIRGPHLLQQWSYRTGFAQGGQAIATQVITSRFLRG